jgi:molybdate transport system ATP-binding protein
MIRFLTRTFNRTVLLYWAMPWIIMENCAAGDWRHRVLSGLNWEWDEGTSWVVAGPNGSGKSALAALWVGRLDAVAGRLERHPAFARAEEAWIGFERQRLLLEWERHIDLSDVSESPDPGTLVADFVGDHAVLARFGLDGKGGRGVKHLSTGELRRACLARAWVLGLPFLILDEPFEGLDTAGVALLRSLLAEARDHGRDLVFLTRRPDDRPPGNWEFWNLGPGVAGAPRAEPLARAFAPPAAPGEPVLEFRQVTAGYPGVPVLTAFNWTVRRGERWLVTGPNGSGKSTLLSLISGDHPQVFGNDVRLFGLRRGPDLTLAQVRKRAPLVSYAAHLGFRNLFGVTGLEVLASGFAGTVGLWSEPSWDEVHACRQLAEAWGLSEAVQRPWDELSWGTQRLLLLGRVLVTGPELLLLDEPCQGLDTLAQARFLDLVAEWAAQPGHTLVYVTHRPDEVDPAGFQRLLLPQGRS